jgi:hypothetical protein
MCLVSSPGPRWARRLSLQDVSPSPITGREGGEERAQARSAAARLSRTAEQGFPSKEDCREGSERRGHYGNRKSNTAQAVTAGRDPHYFTSILSASRAP